MFHDTGSGAETHKLDTLPGEIIDRIVDGLPNTIRHLEPVCLTSKSFVEPAQRRLLSSIGLWGGFYRDPDRLPGKKLTRYINELTIYLSTPCNWKSGGRPHVPDHSDDFWIWHDTHLPQALEELGPVRCLKIVNMSTIEVYGEIPRDLKAALGVISGRLEVLQLTRIPVTLLPIFPSTLKHFVLSPERRFPLNDHTGAAVHGIPAADEVFGSLGRTQLDSLSITYKGEQHSLADEVNLLPIKHLDLSRLRKLHFGAPSDRPNQEDLLLILKNCRETLEEMRIAPSFLSGSSALSFLQSPNCPNISNFCSLRHFETSLYMIFDPSQAHFDQLTAIHGHAFIFSDSRAIFEAFSKAFFAPLLSLPSSPSALETITLHVAFLDTFQFWENYLMTLYQAEVPLIIPGSGNIPEILFQEGQRRFNNLSKSLDVFTKVANDHFTPALMRSMGFHALDQVLSSSFVGTTSENPHPTRFYTNLKKVRLVVASTTPPPVSFPTGDPGLIPFYEKMFSELEIARRGVLEIVHIKEFRLIEDITGWSQGSL